MTHFLLSQAPSAPVLFPLAEVEAEVMCDLAVKANHGTLTPAERKTLAALESRNEAAFNAWLKETWEDEQCGRSAGAW